MRIFKEMYSYIRGRKLYHGWYLSEDNNYYSTDSGIHCFTSAGWEVEVKDQQIQTEISETVAGQKHMQTGSVTSPPTSMCWSSVYTSNSRQER